MATWPVAWKRRLGLLGFCVLCVLPTASILAWALAWRLPNHTEHVTAELSCVLGWKVTAGGVEHLRPNEYQLREVTFVEPLANTPLARCDRLLVTWRMPKAGQKGAGRIGGQSLLLRCGLLQLDVQRPGLLARLTAYGVGHSLGRPATQLRFTADRALLRTEQTVYSLSKLRVELGRRLEVELRAQFLCDDFPTPEPIQIRFGRNANTDPPPVGYGIYTGNGPLPAGFLSLFLPGFQHLGAEAVFHGYVWLFDSANGRAGQIVGRLQRVSLDKLAERWPTPTLRGTVTVNLTSLRLCGGRISEAAGTVEASHGAVHRQLLAAISNTMQVAVADAAEQWIPFDELAAEFHIDSRGLVLRGRCSGGSNSVWLVGGNGLAVRQPLGPIPWATVAQVLSPNRGAQMPATKEVVDLMRWLPLPEQGRRAVRSASAPQPGGQEATVASANTQADRW